MIPDSTLSELKRLNEERTPGPLMCTGLFVKECPLEYCEVNLPNRVVFKAEAAGLGNLSAGSNAKFAALAFNSMTALIAELEILRDMAGWVERYENEIDSREISKSLAAWRSLGGTKG